MIEYAYRLELDQPVSAGRRAERSNVRLAHDVLPGSTVRGALASRWFAEDNAADDAFVRIFERDVVFGQARPATARLVSLSAARCKYPDGTDCETWTQDAAAAVAAGGRPPGTCPHCGGTLSYGRGWRVREQLRVRGTHTELDESERAATGQLFTREALRRGAVLTGRLLAREPVAWLEQPRRVWLGGRRSVLGACRWSVAPVTTPVTTAASGRVALRLRSPAIVVDRYGAPALSFAPALQAALGRAIEPVAEWTRPVSVQGWHTVSGLPKPQEWAVEAGSTCVVEGLAAGDTAVLRAGIGLRRIEGYGEIEVLAREQSDEQADTVAATAADLEARAAPAAPTSAPADPLDRLLVAVSPERRETTLSGLATGLARMGGYWRARGVTDRLREEQVQKVVDGAWARDLPPTVRDEVLLPILRDPAYREWSARVEARLGRERDGR